MTEIRTATKADVPAVSDVLARAFADDPVIRWLLPDGRGIPRMFTVLTRHAHAAPGAADIAYDETGILGAALWDPPGHKLSGGQEFRTALAFIRAMRRRVIYGQKIEQIFHKARPQGEFWYLAQIGAPTPGKGTGSALLASRLDRITGPAYLESSKEANIPLYERFGFTVTTEIRLPRNGPTVWPMWRPAP